MRGGKNKRHGEPETDQFCCTQARYVHQKQKRISNKKRKRRRRWDVINGCEALKTGMGPTSVANYLA